MSPSQGPVLLGTAVLLHVPDHLSGQYKARKTKPPHPLSSTRGCFQPDRVDSIVKGKVCQRGNNHFPHISSKAQWKKHELQHKVMIVFWWSCTTWFAAAAAAIVAVAVAAVAAAVVVAAV